VIFIHWDVQESCILLLMVELRCHFQKEESQRVIDIWTSISAEQSKCLVSGPGYKFRDSNLMCHEASWCKQHLLSYLRKVKSMQDQMFSVK
jgi:hypothetical protein